MVKSEDLETGQTVYYIDGYTVKTERVGDWHKAYTHYDVEYFREVYKEGSAPELLIVHSEYYDKDVDAYYALRDSLRDKENYIQNLLGEINLKIKQLQ